MNQTRVLQYFLFLLKDHGDRGTDYIRNLGTTREFSKTFQDKMHFSAHGHTAEDIKQYVSLLLIE